MINVFFKTYGCQANVADSEGLANYLRGLGCAKVEDEAAADLIMVNTCAIRDKAEQKMFSYLGALVQYREAKPYLRIGVIGCVASYRKQQIYERYDHVNFVFGAKENMREFQAYLADIIVSLDTTKQMHEMGHYVAQASGGQDRDIKGLVKEKNLTIPEHSVVEGGATFIPATKVVSQVQKSYVNIMSGCDNYCSYCIVPFTRGREKSYPIAEIVTRVQHDVEHGAKEVTLIGQNVNSYKDPETGASFAQLLEAVALIPGDFWVRYISPHPKDMTNDVLDIMAKYGPKLCGWIHLPLQAGSDRVLDLMNRTYTVEKFMEQVGEIRTRLPHATITTDIIVGFPSETHEEYLGTRAVMEAVRFDHIFSFIYSPRKYTKAFVMGDDVPEAEKSARLEELQKRQQIICLEQNKRMCGKTFRVLVEQKVSEGLLARTEGNVRVLLQGDSELIGKFVDVLVTEAHVADVRAILTENVDKSCQASTKSL